MKCVYSETQSSNFYWLLTSNQNCPWLWLYQHHTAIYKLIEPSWMRNKSIFHVTKSISSKWFRETWSWTSQMYAYSALTVMCNIFMSIIYNVSVTYVTLVCWWREWRRYVVRTYGFTWEPQSSLTLRENANEYWLVDVAYLSNSPCIRV